MMNQLFELKVDLSCVEYGPMAKLVALIVLFFFLEVFWNISLGVNFRID